MDSSIKSILTANRETIEKALDDFIENNSQVFNFPELNDGDRDLLWSKLYEHAVQANNNQLVKIFSTLRILSREKNSLGKLVTDDWLNLIEKHIGLIEDFQINEENEFVVIEGQKCLCNIVFNSYQTAQKCCKLEILNNILKRISKHKGENVPNEVKFFDLKLLFLLTALCPQIRKTLREDQNADEHLIQIMETTLENAIDNKHIINEKTADMICELLKAFFNLTLHLDGNDEETLIKYKHLTSILRDFLLISTDNTEKTNTLHQNVINLLTNMPSDSLEALICPIDKESPKEQYDGYDMSAIAVILDILRMKFDKGYTISSQHELLSPTITVLLKSACSVRLIRKYLKLSILPPLKDVHNRPEEGSTLRNNLCRLLTTPIICLRDITAELLFVLCKNNVTRMIKYTGYGNAAGLFAKRGLLGGKKDEGEANFSSDSGDSETEEYAEHKHGINPVLGCYEKPHPNPMENMTEEQQEYEAMKLVQLMDQLSKCRTIKPCRVGEDGKPQPIEHVLQLQEGMNIHLKNNDSDSD